MSSVSTVPEPLGQASAVTWPFSKRFAFRFAFVFFLLWAIPLVADMVPSSNHRLYRAVSGFWYFLVPWVGRHILHLSRNITVFGSGDTVYNNIRVLTNLALSLIAAAIWTIADRRARNYTVLYDWLRVIIRYTLACSALAYGMSKLFREQFPHLGLIELSVSFGDLHPQELLWNFMGFSRPYQIFCGSVECLGAALLFWRRTTTLGAILLVGAMTNVFVMDVCYGVDVKMIALQLLIVAAFLVLPDLGALWNLLVLHRATAPSAQVLFPRPPRGPIWHVAKAAVVLYIVGINWIPAYKAQEEGRSAAVHNPPIYGLNSVSSFALNGTELKPDDPRRWGAAAFAGDTPTESDVVIRNGQERWTYYSAKYDPKQPTFSVSSYSGVVPGPAYVLRYTNSAADTVLLHGSLEAGPVDITLNRLPDPVFPLTQPGALRWIYRW